MIKHIKIVNTTLIGEDRLYLNLLKKIETKH